MGNSGAKRTNKLLEDQRGSYINPLGRRLEGYGAEDRDYQTGQRGRITDEYWNLYNGLGEDGSGGGGGGFSPTIADARMNEAMPFYREAMNTGLFSDADRNDWRNRQALSSASIFGGLRQSLNEAANIRGGGFAGYNSSLAKLSRDKAREIEAGRLGAEASLQGQIRDNRFRGGEGVGKYDTEFMNNQRMVEGMRNSAGAAGAARRGDDFRERMSILSELRQLRGESGSDLPYLQLAGRQYDSGLNAINARREEVPAWQQAVGALGGLAGAAAPFLGGGGIPGLGGQKKQKRQYGPTYEELGYDPYAR